MQDGTRNGKSEVRLSIDSSLVERAMQRSVDLEELLERALTREFDLGRSLDASSAAGEEWRRENAHAIADWNDELERNGLWSDGLRAF